MVATDKVDLTWPPACRTPNLSRPVLTVLNEKPWRAEAARRGIPEPDSNPLVAGGRSVRRVWRRHYVAALIDEADSPAVQPLEDLGFEVIRFEDPESWRAAFARLAAALGHVS